MSPFQRFWSSVRVHCFPLFIVTSCFIKPISQRKLSINSGETWHLTKNRLKHGPTRWCQMRRKLAWPQSLSATILWPRHVSELQMVRGRTDWAPSHWEVLTNWSGFGGCAKNLFWNEELHLMHYNFHGSCLYWFRFLRRVTTVTCGNDSYWGLGPRALTHCAAQHTTPGSFDICFGSLLKTNSWIDNEMIPSRHSSKASSRQMHEQSQTHKSAWERAKNHTTKALHINDFKVGFSLRF